MKKILLFILFCTVSMSLFTWENHDWLTEYSWYIEDGRYVLNSRAEHIYWHAHQTPYVEFHKFEIPSMSALYQVRLRNESFYFLYQTDEKEKYFPLEATRLAGSAFEITFMNDFSRMTRERNGLSWGFSDREGGQYDSENPLVGIWGRLPSLNEYRLVNPTDCIYYLEIDKAIPAWAVREGTYLLKQIEDNVFETISSFPDGNLKLEILKVKNETIVLITPLFTLPNERGLTVPLALRRIPKRQGTEN